MGAALTLLWLLLSLHTAHTDADCSFDTPRNLAADSGTFKSQEGYGRVNYDDSQNCSWLITVSAGWAVRLNMEEFELEGQSGCTYDSVTIYDGTSTSDRLIGRYCGTYAPFPDIPNSSSNRILIVFRTSHYNTGSGFQFSWVRSMVTFSEYNYTGRVVEGRTGGSSVTFSVPPHAEGGAEGITYSLVGSLASKLSIDSNTAAVRLSDDFHAEPYIKPCIGDRRHLLYTDELGIQATDGDGDFATVPLTVKLCATAASAFDSLIVTARDLDSLMKVNLDSGEIRFISGTESPHPWAVGLDITENWLYWSISTGALMRMQVTGQEEEAETFYQLHASGDSSNNGIFVDSESRTLYYTDHGNGIIGSVDMSSKEHAVLLQPGAYKYLRKVVVDDSREYLYFTTTGTRPSVSRLRLIDGVTEVLVNSSLEQPYGLAINNTIGRLYVCDFSRGLLQVNVDGSELSPLNYHRRMYCVSMALKINVLYVSSLGSYGRIIMLDADTGDVLRVYDAAGLGIVLGLVISPGGCADGWSGTQCKTECPCNCIACEKIDYNQCTACKEGTYGARCEQPCPANCNGSQCSISGTCFSCVDGYYGDTCDTCVDGFYGESCSSLCPVNCNGSQCSISGTCLSCVDGFYGESCSSLCPVNCNGSQYSISVGIGIGVGLSLLVVLVVVMIVMISRKKFLCKFPAQDESVESSVYDDVLVMNVDQLEMSPLDVSNNPQPASLQAAASPGEEPIHRIRKQVATGGSEGHDAAEYEVENVQDIDTTPKLYDTLNVPGNNRV